ncbi:hypothetical protein [Pontibacter oryzae]|uniref:Uncharacterized protein n=1 Tax=Pontibacter oryzae TaxID=2304593 RepID=A0A399RXL8_9BACT|nr:hypothetical protein [Pontibacter oryzae]RIJ36730.1 hypothetical protein D1627_12900 [Pontibacter oryzae]
MNVRKTLHAGFTLSLLVLAVYLLHWQETGLKQVYSAPEKSRVVTKGSNPAVRSVCCLEHALQAVRHHDIVAPNITHSFRKMVKRKLAGNKQQDSAAHHLASVSLEGQALTN